MYLPIAQRVAIRAALPFQSEYPACAFGAARRDYVGARSDELATLRSARAVVRSSPSPMDAGWYGRQVEASRRYLANIRAARRAILAAEAR